MLHFVEMVIRADPEQAMTQHRALLEVALRDPDLFTGGEIDAAFASGFAWHREHHPEAQLSTLAQQFRELVEEWHACAQKSVAAGKLTVRQAYNYYEGRIEALNEELGSG